MIFPCKRHDGWYMVSDSGAVVRGPFVSRDAAIAEPPPTDVGRLVDMVLDRDELAELDRDDKTIAAFAQLAEDVENGKASEELAEIFQTVKQRVINRLGKDYMG